MSDQPAPDPCPDPITREPATYPAKLMNYGEHELTVLLVGTRYIKLSPGASAWVRRIIVDGQNKFCDCEDGCRWCTTAENADSKE